MKRSSFVGELAVECPTVFVNGPCVAGGCRGELPCSSARCWNDGAVTRGRSGPGRYIVHIGFFGREIHEHITIQLPLGSVKVHQLSHLQGTIGQVGERRLTNMVAVLSTCRLIVDDTEVVHAQALKDGERDNQGGVAHVADVHSKGEVGHPAVWKLVPSYVVVFSVFEEEANLHVIGR